MNRKILIIDDEPDVTRNIEHGFTTDFCSDSMAYKNFRDGIYDLVLLDIKMPNVDGFQVIPENKKDRQGVKICFLTAGEFYHELEKKKDLPDKKRRKPIEIAAD